MAEIFWDVLGIAPTTDTKKIRKAYSELVKKHNPEDDEEAFRRINHAYRAAMNFARQLSSLNITDDKLVISDRHPDGSFNIQIKKDDAIPSGFPVMGKPIEEEQEATESLFDFGDIDSSKVKELTFEEIDARTGYLSLAPGFPVPDSEKARRIKRFIDDNDLVTHMTGRVKRDEIEKGITNAIYTAELILNDEELKGERILWNFYFNSPLVASLYTSFEFYSQLEKLVDDARITPAMASAIGDYCPLHPRIYISTRKPNGTEVKIDFRSNVTFIYKENKYPDFDELMKDEKPEDVKELISFLEKVRLNLYSMLMPRIHPIKKHSIFDAIAAFNFILKNTDCAKMRHKPIIWKLFFQGNLIKPMINDHDLHIGITRSMLELDLPKSLVKTMKKQLGGQVCFIRLKAGTKDSYYLTFMDSDIQKDKNNATVYVPYGQVTPWVQNFVSIAVFVLVLIMAILMGMTLMQKN